MNYYTTFLNKLHKVADNHDMTALAKAAGVKYTWLSKVNAGSIKNPGIRDIEKVNDVIDSYL